MSLNLIHIFFFPNHCLDNQFRMMKEKFQEEKQKQDKRGKTHSLAYQHGLRVFSGNFMDGLGVGYFFLSMIYFDRCDFVCKQRHLVAFWHESLRRPFRTGLVWNNQQIHQLWDQHKWSQMERQRRKYTHFDSFFIQSTLLVLGLFDRQW